MKTGTVCVPFYIVTLEARKKQVEKFLKDAAMQEIRFLVFPELCFTQRTEEAIAAQNRGRGFHQFSEAVPGGANYAIMAEAAQKHGMTVIYGAFERVDDKHMYNTAAVIGPDGELLGKHLNALLASGEGEDFEGETLAGDELEWIATPAGKAAVITCYEMYFPEVARVYDLKGADFFVYIHADNGEVTRDVARTRSRDSYMPLICSCYASTAGAFQ